MRWLRLDDRGDASVGLELRRVSVASARWSGIRMVDATSIAGPLRFSSELELAIPMPDRATARREEARIKRLPRTAKLALLPRPVAD